MESRTMNAEKHARSAGYMFPLVTAVLAFSYHALIAALCTYLPQEAFMIGYGLAGYATAGCAISLLGIYGILTQNRGSICLFSHFLLLDALISTCARVLVLELFFNATHSQDTCTDIVEAIWTDQKQPSHDAVSSPAWQHALFKAGLWCRFALGAVHVAGVAVLISTCVAQATVALAVRNHAMQTGASLEQTHCVDLKHDLEGTWDVKQEIVAEI